MSQRLCILTSQEETCPKYSSKMDSDFKSTPTYNPQQLLKCRQPICFEKGPKSLTKNTIPWMFIRFILLYFIKLCTNFWRKTRDVCKS